MTKIKPIRDWRQALPGLLLVLAVLLAYFPALRGDFLWDDDANIINSASLRSLAGLGRIWFKPGATQQYYPLTHTTFWLDYHLWGLHPWGYHLENVLLHALNAVLLWLILRRLSVKGAWLGAALYALHPVCVESVAWITERKNTLSGVFFLGSLFASVKFWRLDETLLPASAQSGGRTVPAFGPRKFYWLALVFYLCALWSKTASVGMPGVILFLVWWKQGRFGARDFALLTPFLALGLGMALITMWVENTLLGASAAPMGLSLLERCLLAARGLWFYIGKLIWPHPLMFMYPRWTIRAAQPMAYLPLAGAAALGLILWHQRNSWGRPALVAAGCMVAMLFPVLGFFNLCFFQFTFVSDHFQYLASIGPLALAAAGITMETEMAAKRKPLLKPVIIYTTVLLALGVLTWRQSGIYRNLEILWRDTLAQNPDSWLAHDELGLYLSHAGRFEEATDHYRRAIQLNAGDYMAHYDLGLDFARRGAVPEAMEQFGTTLQIYPGFAPGYYQLGNALVRKGEVDQAVQQYTKALEINPNYALGHYNLGSVLARQGKWDEAIQHLTAAVELDPDSAPAAFSLGNALTGRGKLDEAIQYYELALQLQPDFERAHANLGRALAGKGKLDEAIDHYRKALQINPKSVDSLANLGNALLVQKRYGEAITCFRAALQVEPNSPVIHHNLGVALARLDRQAEAQDEFDKAQQLKPVSP